MAERDSKGRFLPGNTLWEEAISKITVRTEPRFKNGEELLEAVIPYFEWVRDNPYRKPQGGISRDGEPVLYDLEQARPLTLAGLLAFTGISNSCWDRMAKHPDYAPWVGWIRSVIKADKVDGALAGVYNASLVSRLEGLSDKSEISGPNGGPIRTEETSARQLLLDHISLLAARARENEVPDESDGGASE